MRSLNPPRKWIAFIFVPLILLSNAVNMDSNLRHYKMDPIE